MKRLTLDSTWWHRVPHREITRSVAQGEGGQPWTILASIGTRRTARCTSWSRGANCLSAGSVPIPPLCRHAGRARILLEASTESEGVARCLEALGHHVVVADPNVAPMYATRTRKAKTDRRDDRALAEACLLGATGPRTGSPMPS